MEFKRFENIVDCGIPREVADGKRIALIIALTPTRQIPAVQQDILDIPIRLNHSCIASIPGTMNHPTKRFSLLLWLRYFCERRGGKRTCHLCGGILIAEGPALQMSGKPNNDANPNTPAIPHDQGAGFAEETGTNDQA